MKRSTFQFTLGFALACAAITFSLAVCAQAQTVTFLADFNGGNGWEPYGSVVQATDGNFYGTTSGGEFGHGNVFRITPAGEITSIYTFCPQNNCATGAFPTSAPLLGSDGNLYGVTATTVYRLKLGGEITTLYTFCSLPGCTDGGSPNGMILASDGNFYGTTNYGGTAGVGTIFKISPAGEFSSLYSFCSQANCVDGSYPYYPLVQGNDGNFYGTTLGGGANQAGGVFYELTASGAYNVLYNFCTTENNSSCVGGAYAYAIAKGADGNFYGTTDAGGAHGEGVVFALTPTGQYTDLYNFEYNANLGWPGSQLTLASDGNLYGTFIGGGSGSWAPIAAGGIYEVTPAGVFTGLYDFCHCNASSGYTPLDPVFQATDGNFYGTTAYNGYTGTKGNSGFGTVFKLSTGLGPLVETAPVAGPVGQSVIILGNGLTGSTSVTFDGVEAAFTVESDAYIKATVPKGATTGAVSVVTPSGTLNSNPQFVVTK